MAGKFTATIGGAIAGASYMYFADPERGRRRRAQLKDSMTRLRSDGAWLREKGIADLEHRAQGVVAQVRHRLTGLDGQEDDEKTVARVRSAIGHVCSHPHALLVTAHEGQVSISGPVLKEEADEIVAQAIRVAGVSDVEDRMSRHEVTDGIPALQGEARGGGPYTMFGAHPWRPGERLLALAGGSALLGWGLVRRGLAGKAGTILGGSLIARATMNQDLLGLAGVREGATFSVRKDLHLDAPPDLVFRVWESYFQFPKFMENVERVRPRPHGHWLWAVHGPFGTPIRFEAEVTRREENERIAWKTVSGSMVEHEGEVRFLPDRGGTRLEIHLDYCPPMGLFGHLAARALFVDPKRLIDEDLIRFKSLIENEKTSAHGHEVKRDEVLRDAGQPASMMPEIGPETPPTGGG